MKIENLEVEQTLEKVKKQIEEEKNLSPALRASLELLLTLVTFRPPDLGDFSLTSASRNSGKAHRFHGG